MMDDPLDHVWSISFSSLLLTFSLFFAFSSSTSLFGTGIKVLFEFCKRTGVLGVLLMIWAMVGGNLLI